MGAQPHTTAELYKSFVDYFYKYKFSINEKRQESLNQALGELSQWAINLPASPVRKRQKAWVKLALAIHKRSMPWCNCCPTLMWITTPVG